MKRYAQIILDSNMVAIVGGSDIGLPIPDSSSVICIELRDDEIVEPGMYYTKDTGFTYELPDNLFPGNEDETEVLKNQIRQLIEGQELLAQQLIDLELMLIEGGLASGTKTTDSV